ncbi:MAG: hypothetical protein IAE81_10185 [Caldilineaceae bacterium]|nr:hypothetical protein [Caldilineaceae bacterium]
MGWAFLLTLAFLSASFLFAPAARAQTDLTPRDTRTWADPNSGPSFTFSVPDIYNSCSTRGDRIWTTGMRAGWRLNGNVRVRQPLSPDVVFTEIAVNQTGDLNLLVPYPPVSEWQDNTSNREIHVDLSIGVFDENNVQVGWIGGDPVNAPGVLGPGGQDWDVYCDGVQTPDIDIIKFTNGADANNPDAAGVPVIAPGALVTWTYLITNIGNVDIPLSEITVTDNIPNVNPIFTSVVSGDLKGDGNGLLQPSEVWLYTATGASLNLSNPGPVPGLQIVPNVCRQGNASAPGSPAYTNVGTVQIPNTSATDPSSYCNPSASLAVSKTAATAYTRTYGWEIAKRVSPAVVNLFEGQNADVTYSVQVTRTGPVDSGFQVSGSIYITNTGVAAVTINSVADAISGVATPAAVVCPVALPTSLGANSSLVCTYSAPLTDAAARTNTATVTYNDGAQQTGTAPVVFGDPTTVVNGSISVQDVYNGLPPQIIGAAITGSTTLPAYQRNVVCGSDLGYVNGVASYTRANTATIVETGGNASTTMTVNCYRPSVSKTVDPDFTRRFTWQILKTVAPSQINLLDGQSTTATYTVTLTKSNPIDENFRVFGNITVNNPNLNSSLGLTGITDQLSNGQNVGVTCPSTTVPAGGTLVCSYSTNVPNNADGTNTATVTATTGIVYTSPVVPYTFVGVPPSQTTLNSVDVTDTNPATGQPWTFSASGSQNYQLPFACVDIAYDANGVYQTTVNNTVTITQTGQQSSAVVNLTCRLPQVTVSSVCVNGQRTWSAIASDAGAYIADFIAGGVVVESVNLNLTANTPQTFTYSGDPTTLERVEITFNGNLVAQENGPYEDCVTAPAVTLGSVCVDNTRTWTVNSSQSGAYTAEFVIDNIVVASTPLTLVANTNQTFTYSGDPTTLDLVRVTFNGNGVAQEIGPFESCAPPPTGALSSVCTDDVRTWTVNVSQPGAYVAQFVIGGAVVSSLNLNLAANTPQTFTYSGDPTTLDLVRVLYNGALVAQEAGPFESCIADLPTVVLVTECVENEGLLWQATATRTGAYVAQLTSPGGQVIESVPLSLTANTPQSFAFTADAYTPNVVRVFFQGTQVLEQVGPESCVSGLSIALAPACTRTGETEWTVLTNIPGSYTAQLVSGVTVIESIPLTLEAGVDAQFIFQNDSSSPRVVRLIFQQSAYAEQEGLDIPCVPTSLPPTEEPTVPGMMSNFIYLPTVTRR